MQTCCYVFEDDTIAFVSGYDCCHDFEERTYFFQIDKEFWVYIKTYTILKEEMLVYMSGLFGSALSFFTGILVGVVISVSLLVRPFDLSQS